MKGKRKTNSRLMEALLETARDMRKSGILSAARYEKITRRHAAGKTSPASQPIAAADIRALRERAKLSQAVFASYLNVTPGYISQLERGAKAPKGAALALLNVARRKGMSALM